MDSLALFIVVTSASLLMWSFWQIDYKNTAQMQGFCTFATCVATVGLVLMFTLHIADSSKVEYNSRFQELERSCVAVAAIPGCRVEMPFEWSEPVVNAFGDRVSF